MAIQLFILLILSLFSFQCCNEHPFTLFLSANASLSGFPGGIIGKESICQCRRRKRCRFNPWVGKIPWRRKWQPTPVFLPGKCHGQRSLAGYSPRGHKESDMTEHSRRHRPWDVMYMINIINTAVC